MSTIPREGQGPPAIKLESQVNTDGRSIRDMPPVTLLPPNEEHENTTQTLAPPESSADDIGSSSVLGYQDTLRRQMNGQAIQSTTDAQDLKQISEMQQQVSGIRDGPLAQGPRRKAEEAGITPDSAATAAPQQSPEQLLFRSNPAADAHQNRLHVDIPVDDDVDEVVAKNEQYVIRILNAYNEDYRREMEGLGKKHKFTKEYYQNKWDEWQARALKEVNDELKSSAGKNLREIRARELLVSDEVSTNFASIC